MTQLFFIDLLIGRKTKPVFAIAVFFALGGGRLAREQVLIIAIFASLLAPISGTADAGRNNGEYAIHEDGGIIYNPLSREARRKGLLEKFAQAKTKKGKLELGEVTLTYEAPEAAEAYDVLPVRYVLENRKPDTQRPLAVECTAFEEKARFGGKPLFDMSLPGDLSARIEYVGSISAAAAPSRPLLDPRQPNPEIKDYPGWISHPLTRSGVIRKSDYVWFTFKYTVTGNTIYDPEGFNGVQSFVELFRKQKDGSYKTAARPINKWERNTAYQYPGESCEQTVMMSGGRNVMPPGEYRLRFSLVQKAYTKWSLFRNHWAGEWFAMLDVDLKVVEGTLEPNEPILEHKILPSATSGNFPEYIHSFEEFMTGFEWYRNPIRKEESTVYVQVAPWTEQLVVKLIGGSPMELRTASIPIVVSTRNVILKHNPDNPFVLQRGTKEEPVIMSQLMPSMRHSVHFGPRPDKIMEELVRDAKECGVNVYCSESGGWALWDFYRSPQKHDVLGEATRYFNSHLPQWGMPMVGHGIYATEQAYQIGSKLLDQPLDLTSIEIAKGSSSMHFAYPEWSKAWAAIALYHHQLYGGNWYKTRDGRTIIDIEDSAGWLREGLHIRHPAGKRNIAAFREWCRTRHGTIENVNRAWSSSFKDFTQIDPEASQELSAGGNPWDSSKKTNPVFYDWSRAMEDFDTYLSEARCVRYREVLDIVRKEIPGATFDLRTEGGNFIIPGSSKLGDTPHELHVKYSARRNAMIGEVLAKHRDVIGFYSDYTTLPYTPDEWRKFTRLSVEAGIRPMPLPHLARTRDMAVQQKWGEDYTVHYNLKYPAKAVMVFGLQALFPVMKAIYEEGGCPGVIWADYLCDAFVTETQKRELKILRKAMENTVGNKRCPQNKE